MENDAWAEKEVVCGGYMEETINYNGGRVQREIREKMMVFVLGIINKVSKHGELVQLNIFKFNQILVGLNHGSCV